MSEITPEARRTVVRAWKDESFRNSLPAEVREKLPAAPDGASEMSDEQLDAAAGGIGPLAAAVIGGVVSGGVSGTIGALTD